MRHRLRVNLFYSYVILITKEYYYSRVSIGSGVSALSQRCFLRAGAEALPLLPCLLSVLLVLLLWPLPPALPLPAPAPPPLSRPLLLLLPSPTVAPLLGVVALPAVAVDSGLLLLPPLVVLLLPPMLLLSLPQLEVSPFALVLVTLVPDMPEPELEL